MWWKLSSLQPEMETTLEPVEVIVSYNPTLRVLANNPSVM